MSKLFLSRWQLLNVKVSTGTWCQSLQASFLNFPKAHYWPFLPCLTGSDWIVTPSESSNPEENAIRLWEKQLKETLRKRSELQACSDAFHHWVAKRCMWLLIHMYMLLQTSNCIIIIIIYCQEYTYTLLYTPDTVQSINEFVHWICNTIHSV